VLEISAGMHLTKKKVFLRLCAPYVPINPFTTERAPRALIDFTLSNARRFYSSKGEPLGRERVKLFLIVLINIQLSPEEEVNSGGYIPRRETSRYISTALQRP